MGRRKPDKLACAALAAAASCAALPAAANTGIGLLAMAVPPMIVALVPAILVEAPVLARFLKVPLRRGLWMSFLANLVSTFFGALIAVASQLVIPIGAMDVSREWTLASLLPMLFVSWWLEAFTIRGMQPSEQRPAVRRATGWANAITYAGMAVFVALTVPTASAVFSRWKLTGPINELGVARVEVAEHFQQHKTYPPPRTFASTNVNVRSIAWQPEQRLVLILSFPGSPDGDGKRIIQEPKVVDGQIVEWRCHSPDLHAKYLPASCR